MKKTNLRNRKINVMKRSRRFIALSAMVLTSLSSSVTAQLVPKEKLGIQADAAVTVDRGRTSRVYKAEMDGDAKLDADSWPMEDCKIVFLDGRAYPGWLGDAAIEDPEKYNSDHSGVWKISFDGQADISIVEGAGITFTNKKYDAASNRTSVDMTMIRDRAVQATSVCYLKFSNTKRTAASATNTGITKIKFITPGYDVNSQQMYVDGYYDALCPFGILRTMGLNNANGNVKMGEFFDADNTLSWSERSMPGGQQNASGTAWEHIIDLANRTNKHLWITVPIHADANFMDELAKLFKTKLNPGLKIYVELSNEVWNPGFTQWQYNLAAAIDEVKKNPNSNLKKAGETEASNQGIWAVRRHMKRTIELTKAFQKAYGNDCVGKTIFPQFAWWTWVNKEYYEQAFQWCKDNYGEPSLFLHAMCISGYSEDLGKPSSTVDALLALQKPRIDKSYTDDFLGHKATADKWKLKLTVYEGSTNFTETFNIKNKFLAVRDPRFEDIVKYLVQDTWFNKLKGDEFCFFALAGNWSSFGTWAIAEPDFVKQRWENSPKWKALTKMTGTTCVMNGMGPTGVISNYEDVDNNISLYPVPSTGVVNLAVRTYTAENVSIKVSDISGKTVKTFDKVNVANGIQLLNLAELENGIYFVNINDAGRNISEKIVIAK